MSVAFQADLPMRCIGWALSLGSPDIHIVTFEYSDDVRDHHGHDMRIALPLPAGEYKLGQTYRLSWDCKVTE